MIPKESEKRDGRRSDGISRVWVDIIYVKGEEFRVWFKGRWRARGPTIVAAGFLAPWLLFP